MAETVVKDAISVLVSDKTEKGSIIDSVSLHYHYL